MAGDFRKYGFPSSGTSPILIGPLGLLAIAILVFRLLLAGNKYALGFDEVTYLTLGANLIWGRGYLDEMGTLNVTHPPLYPLLAGLSKLLMGDPERVAKGLFLMCSVLQAIPLYWLARELAGPAVAFRSLLLFIAMPALTVVILFSGTHGLYIFLTTLHFCIIWRALQTGSVVLFSLGATLAGLAYLARLDGLIVFLLTLLLLAVRTIVPPRPRRLVRGVHLILYAVVFGLCVAPYSFYVHQRTGRWINNLPAVVFVQGWAHLDPNLSPATTPPGWFATTLSTYRYSVARGLLADPSASLRRVLHNAHVFCQLLPSLAVFPWFLFLLVGLGLFERPWDVDRLKADAFVAFMLLPSCVYLLFHVNARYLSPMVPALTIWAARGLQVLERHLYQTALGLGAKPWTNRWLSRLPALLLIGVLAAITLAYQFVKFPSDARPAYKDMGRWIRHQMAISDIRLAIPAHGGYGRYLAFYAGRPAVPPYLRSVPVIVRDPEALLAWCRALGMTHVLIDRALVFRRGSLAALLDERQGYPGFKFLVAQYPYGLFLYRLSPGSSRAQPVSRP